MTRPAFARRTLATAILVALGALASNCANTKFEGGVAKPAAKKPAEHSGDAHQAVTIPVGDTKKLADLVNQISNGDKPQSVEPAEPGIVKYDPKTGELIAVAPGTTDVVVTLPDGTVDTVSVTVTKKDVTPPAGVGSGSGPASGSVGSDQDSISGTATPATMTDGDLINATPGVPVVQLGINFEDLGPFGDHDYNDAVLCFQGKFKVDGANVVSIAKQTVTGTTSSHSGCHHNIRVEITGKDGTKQTPITYDSRAATPVTMNFEVGSKLDVFMTPYDGCSPGVQHTQYEPDYAHVLPNQCNTSGN